MAPNLVVNTVAAFSKALLRFGCKEVQVNGLDNFLRVLQDHKRRDEGRGLLTYCNHISVMDEPTIWGSLPWSTFRSPDTTRWTLGASDIMFTNDTLRRFFTAGQVIETHRGGGIFQPSIDTAISRLDMGQWIHLFPEGYVNVGTTTKLRRFKWGLSRMVIEAKERPVIVPIWITGFDRLMPEPRPFPKFLPRLGASLSITFGDPVDSTLAPFLSSLSPSSSSSSTPLIDSTLLEHASERQILSIRSTIYPNLSPTSRGYTSLHSETSEKAHQRSYIAAVLRDEMATLAKKVRIMHGMSPDEETTLVHTTTLIKEKGGSIKDDHEEGAKGKVKDKVHSKLQRGIGKEVKRKEAEQGWKDSAT